MTAYSQDLRKRILDTVQRGEGSLRQIARRFLVSVSFVTRLLRLHRSTGSLEPKPHGGGNPAALGPEDLERLRELVRMQPDATLEELRQRLGASCSLMTISRALCKLGLPRKKKTPAPKTKTVRTSNSNGGNSAPNWPAWTRGGWSSSMRAGPTRR